MKLITVTLPEEVMQRVRDFVEKESTDAYEQSVHGPSRFTTKTVTEYRESKAARHVLYEAAMETITDALGDR